MRTLGFYCFVVLFIVFCVAPFVWTFITSLKSPQDVIWTLSAFFRDLPRELEEAAWVDGASRTQTFLRIIAPLATPGVFTTAILLFIAAWNEFLFARTFISLESQLTAPVAIAQFEGADIAATSPWGEISAAAVVITLPLVILVLVFQRRIVAGLTAGAVKG